MVTSNSRHFRVSVIIPVYRAERFVEHAVESCLQQAEVTEVVVVEDGSPDKSLDVCRRLAASHPHRVRLVCHPGGENRGAGASRNLGIESSEAPFLAFLDADDYMLPERFAVSSDLLLDSAEIDGVYEAVGFEFVDDVVRPLPKFAYDSDGLITLSRRVAPEDLLEALTTGQYGAFSTDGVVLRREVFEKTGRFNPDLRLSQDTEMWWRIAATCRLEPGVLDRPVAMARRHSDNRYATDNPQIHEAAFEVALSVWRWGRDRDLPASTRRILRNTLESSIGSWHWGKPSFFRLRAIQLKRLIRAVSACPSLLYSNRFLYRFLARFVSRPFKKN